MKFLDVDVKLPLASKSEIVHGGKREVFGWKESFVEPVATGMEIPVCRKNGVLVWTLDAKLSTKPPRFVTFGGGPWETVSGARREEDPWKQ